MTEKDEQPTPPEVEESLAVPPVEESPAVESDEAPDEEEETNDESETRQVEGAPENRAQ